MSHPFQTTVIVGVGLLGGSLGLAMKALGLTLTVRGVGRRQSSLDTAFAQGAIDEAFLDLAKAAVGADLIVICTPADLVVSALDTLNALPGSPLITDVASTKEAICAHATATCPAPRRFIGSHPMAGSERFGPEHATENLFEGRYVIVEPLDAQHDCDAHASIVSLWEAVGMRVEFQDPAEHDRRVARTSHVPHILSACAANAAVAEGTEGLEPFIGSGFRDVTRVAAGRPEIWRDICKTNAPAIVNVLDELSEELAQVRTWIAEGDWARVEAFFEKGNVARAQAVKE